MSRETTFSPVSKRKVGFQRNQRQQSDSEISAVLLSASDATYADGTPIEALKPAAAGADVTAANVASAIYGQGPGATATGTQVLNNAVTIGADGKLLGAGGGQVTYGGVGGKQLGLLDNLFFGSPYFLETSGGAGATLNAFKTILGTANAFLNQGAFATLNSAAYGSSLLTGFGLLSPLSNLAFGSSYLLESSGGASASLANFKTSLGNAAGFAGQGSLATRNDVLYGSMIAGLPTAIAPSQLIDGGLLSAYYSVYSTGIRVTDLKPGEANANVTEIRTAAAIVGQAPAATDATIQIGATRDVAIAGRETTNDNPGYYFGTYPNRTVQERKNASAVGVVTGQSQDIGNLETVVSAVARQTFTSYASARAWMRSHLDSNSWSAWSEVYGQDRKPAFGADLIESGGALASLANFKTSLGNSAGFAGQGSFATQSYLSLDATAYFNMPDRIAPYRYDTIGALSPFYVGGTQGIAARLTDVYPGEFNANKTEGRTSAAIVGQSDWATYGGVPTSGFATRIKNIQNDGAIEAATIYDAGGAGPLSNVYPAQRGANVTETRNSAGFAGQGSFATLSNINRANVSSYLNYNALSLNYTITRQDGTSIVTESLAITQIGIAAGFTGQGALASLNQADTGQIAPSAVSSFQGVNFGITTVNAGEQADSDQRVSFSTTGGRLRVEVSADTVRTGTGTNIGYLQLMVQQPDGSVIQIGRQVKALSVVDGPPVYYVAYVTLNPGAYFFFARLIVGTGKGTNQWNVPSGFLGVEESKR